MTELENRSTRETRTLIKDSPIENASKIHPRICAIIITYNPEKDLKLTIEAVKSQVERIIVIDNGSTQAQIENVRGLRAPGLTIIENPENLGIATALNIGVNQAKAEGFNWVLTLDQDTICEPDMVQKMMDVYRQDTNRDKIAILAAVHFDRQTAHVSKELRNLKETAVDRRIVMTSGNLIPMHIFEKLGPFDDDLFIEYVDNEFCLRARANGYRVVLVRDARMGHQLGDTKKHTFFNRWWFFSHNYKPVRRYYRARNRLVLYRRYKGSWILGDQDFALRDMAKILLVESDKWAKLKATFAGTLDALLGRLGRADGATYSTPKAPRYFVETRDEIIPLLPEFSGLVIDLGCGSGVTSGKLRKTGKFGWVCGVEGNPEVGKIAEKNLDQVIVGDVEKIEYPFEKGSIDTVLTLDILEHLLDPWKVLSQINDLLKPGGTLVVSIPNVRHFSVVIPLLFLGDWRYQQEDILDSTHLRFFTKKTTIRMLEAAGFEIVKVDHNGAKAGLSALVNKLTFGLFKEFFIFQNIVACRKPVAQAEGRSITGNEGELS